MLKSLNRRALNGGFDMNALRSGIAAIVFAFAATASPAATLTSLTAGGMLSAGGLLFDSFSFTDISDFIGLPFITFSSDDIFVTASSVGAVVTLSFDFSPDIFLTTPEAYELAGLFTATATGAVMISVDILLGGQDLFGDALLGPSIADGPMLLAQTELGSGFFAPFGGSTGPATLANLSSFLFGWGSSGETDDLAFAGGDGPGLLRTEGFDIVITLERDALPAIPLPAALPLLLVGIGGLGLARLRRRSA